jgi:hypothetical protein
MRAVAMMRKIGLAHLPKEVVGSREFMITRRNGDLWAVSYATQLLDDGSRATGWRAASDGALVKPRGASFAGWRVLTSHDSMARGVPTLCVGTGAYLATRCG